ncbi:MAG TPA: PDZ domain-containing protein [Pirellulales bacterium]|jgi:serine protease Do|nr:PDZ domain-containing protein [Pirellulales bacterium]
MVLFSSALLALLPAPGSAQAAQSLVELEERAVKAAVAHVAPSVVRIETVGGLERVGQMLVGTGPTTGLVVDPDGLILSSAFNFIQRPDSILVTLADGTRLPAKLVATDHSRMLVLLSVHPPAPLPVAEVVPPEEMRVGQWTIAVGRTLSAEAPNVSVGIVSALDRVWGRAIQTDAKISPTNYGGPLIDISGRVFGLLVPLSPDSQSTVAGVEWYDSGIGFAVPLSGINGVLPRLAAGNDLYPGLLGIAMRAGDLISQPAEIAVCRPHSPASAAGLHVGDTIVEINGKPVTRQAQLKQELNRHYAGDHVRLVVTRSGERLERDIELAEKIPPYEFPFAGILPLRPLAGNPPALVVRLVYPDSPAARAGVQPGDQIVTLAGEPVQTAEQAIERLRSRVPGDKLAIGLSREGQVIAAEIELGRLPEAVPRELPPSHPPAEAKGAEPAVGIVQLAIGEEKNAGFVYVPTNYQSDLRYGVVVWLHGTAPETQDELVARWKPLCEARDLILLAPKSANAEKWQPSDVRTVQAALEEVSKNYAIDPARVVMHGYEGGGALAYLYAFGHADTVRGVAPVGTPLPGWLTVPENDPANRLAIFSAAAGQEALTAAVDAGVTRLRTIKYPVTAKNLGTEPRYLNADELDELVRWIDTLDRF